jgi:hypothetical protein
VQDASRAVAHGSDLQHAMVTYLLYGQLSEIVNLDQMIANPATGQP